MPAEEINHTNPNALPDLEQLIIWLQTHTALDRIGHGELLAALKRAEDDAGFVFTMKAPPNG